MANQTQQFLTPAVLARFLEYATMANTLPGHVPTGPDASDRGYLSNMAKAGLINTFKEDGRSFVEFTAKGAKLAAAHDVDLYGTEKLHLFVQTNLRNHPNI